jgi:hypothetical protein
MPQSFTVSSDSHQLILILINEQNKIQCYQRQSNHHHWKTIGKPIFVTLKPHYITANIQLRRYAFPNQNELSSSSLTIGDHLPTLAPYWHFNTIKNRLKAYYRNPIREYNEEFLPNLKKSLVFMEHCKNNDSCIEVRLSDLKKISTWLNPTKKPLIALLPEATYLSIKDRWNLPDEIYLTEELS